MVFTLTSLVDYLHYKALVKRVRDIDMSVNDKNMAEAMVKDGQSSDDICAAFPMIPRLEIEEILSYLKNLRFDEGRA